MPRTRDCLATIASLPLRTQPSPGASSPCLQAENIKRDAKSRFPAQTRLLSVGELGSGPHTCQADAGAGVGPGLGGSREDLSPPGSGAKLKSRPRPQGGTCPARTP